MANITEQQKEALRFIKQAFINKDEQVIEQVNAITGTPTIVELKGDLLKAYNKLGDNPIKEPKLIYQEGINEDTIFDDMGVVFEATGIDPDKYDISEVSDFVKECFSKVNSFKDKNGKYKKTENTKNAKLPKWSDLQTIMKTLKPIDKLNQEELKSIKLTFDGYDADIDDEDELKLEIEKVKEHYDKKRKPYETKKWKMVSSITGVKVQDLTEWERNLLFTANIMAYVNKELNTPY